MANMFTNIACIIGLFTAILFFFNVVFVRLDANYARFFVMKLNPPL